ncbi:cyclin B like protein [Cryptosporidium ubiquitum]|uniref:Cyclin B like protein n=1 Tax=Cryptosporidium ubiquitum TaxID=857276 RepID=A0A1J4MDH4_9CRYT|nr:cyclin B like protein [Cryptosporidium ubiquitum]OII72031.1 cyclin B like protein [Cryptosporidium ubiquitum]
MTILFKKLKENDVFKNFFRQISKYLESNSDESKENECNITKCDVKKNNKLVKITGKENNYIGINNTVFSSQIFEFKNNLEKSEYQESNSDSKPKPNIEQIVTNRILSKQNEYNMKKVYAYFRECYKKQIESGKTLIDFRREIIGEISEIIWKCHLNEEVLFLAVHFMDNIISKDRIKGSKTLEKLRYLGFTCFYIATKIERVVNFNFKEIIRKLSINPIKILNMEKYVLNQLTFKLNPISSLFLLQFLMGIIMESYLKDIIGIENINYLEKDLENKDYNNVYLDKYNSESFKGFNLQKVENISKLENSSSLIINVLNMKSSKGINKVLEYFISCYLLEICLYDIEILKYSPLCQAISALIIAKECLGARRESIEKDYINEHLNREVLIEDYIYRNINAIKRTLKYPYIKKNCTTKKYLTNEYMNAANYVLRFICPK